MEVSPVQPEKPLRYFSLWGNMTLSIHVQLLKVPSPIDSISSPRMRVVMDGRFSNPCVVSLLFTETFYKSIQPENGDNL